MAHRDFEEGRTGTVGQIEGLFKEGKAYEDWKSGHRIYENERLKREFRERKREKNRREEKSDDWRGCGEEKIGPTLVLSNILFIAAVAYCIGSVGGCFHRWAEYENSTYALNAFKTTGVTSAYVVLAIAMPIWLFWVIRKIFKFFEKSQK